MTADWQSGIGYPPRSASASTWAWEFLRRNPEYRADWAKFAGAAQAAACRYMDKASLSPEWLRVVSESKAAPFVWSDPRVSQLFADLRLKWRMRGLADPDLGWNEPEESPAKGASERGRRRFAERILYEQIETLFVDGAAMDICGAAIPPWFFGVVPPAVSGADLRDHLIQMLQRGAPMEAVVGQAGGLYPFRPHHLVVRIDLRVAHDVLMAELESEIRSLRKRAVAAKQVKPLARRLRADLFPSYLRILDAVQAGVPADQIVAALWPRQANSYPERPLSKRLVTQRKAAFALRDGGWRDLLRLAPPLRRYRRE